MRKIIIISFLGLALMIALSQGSAASSLFDIEFPISELEGCADQSACKAYCDDLAHKDVCLAFAEKHGLVDEATAEKSERLPPVGPGGCRGEEQCRSYCDDSAHLDECLKFAEEHNLIGAEEIERARKFAGETGPGGCKGANQCRAYCEESAHQEECLEFGNRKGLISPQQLEAARSILKGGGPGGCKSPDECRAYCQEPAHTEECVDSAVQLGFMTKDDAARIKKAGLAGGPGGCRGANQCRAYCEDADHQSECIDFGEKNGFMSREEAERARKFAGKPGPGGCRGEECRNFCERSENGDVCLEFAEREGLMPKQELERAKKFLKVSQEGGPGGCRGVQCRDFCSDPAHQNECFEFAKKQGFIRPEEEKQFDAGRKIQEVMRNQGGPGGCKSDDECRAYCADPSRVEECIAFGATHGGLPEGEVRNMLKQFQERRFELRGEFQPPEDFRRFEEEGQRRFEEFRQLEEHFRGGSAFGTSGMMPFQGMSSEGQLGFVSHEGRESQFVGPGGCASPAECIKYCADHKNECFSFGPPGAPDARPPEGGIPPAAGEARFERPGREGERFEPPHLRSDLMFEFKSESLPEGFQNLPPEKREEFFRQNMEKFRSSPGQFPGKPSVRQGAPQGESSQENTTGEQHIFPGRGIESFPARPGEFQNRTPEIFRNTPFENKGPIPGTPGIFGPSQRPLDGFRPSEGIAPQPPEGFHPPEGSFTRPPEGFISPPAGSFVPPPSSSFQPPPPSDSYPPQLFSPPPPSFEPPPPQPSGNGPAQRFFANIIDLL